MAKLIFGIVLLTMFILMFNCATAAALAEDEADNIPRMRTRPLKLSVTHEGGNTIQVVDNQQGQIVKQVVGPAGIHQTVFRNGVKITDDVVPAPKVETA